MKNDNLVRLMRTPRMPLSILLLLFWVLVLLPGAQAQFTSGSINGQIRDSSGALIPNATVTATAVDTGATRTVKTGDNGSYNLANLKAGNYTVKVTVSGFSTQTAHVPVAADHIARWDATLSVGSETQTIQVNAAALALETESHQLSDTVSANQIENLPANGRDVFATLTTQANVQPNTGSGSRSGTDINFFHETGNSLTIGGNVYGLTSFLADGVTNFNLLTKTANLQPSIEATQEVTIVRNGASARFDEPNVVNVVTKGGTNAFHGRVYDYLRNDALNAHVKNDTTKASLRYNQFGANIGGPILHNHLFFFFDYSGLRQHSNSILNAILPTEAQRNGDFSADKAIIYDPSTYNAKTHTISPFPGNKIPSGSISDFAKRLFSYMPLPNGSPIAGYNFQEKGSASTTYDSYFGRIDYNIGAKDTIYGAFATTNPVDFTPTWALQDIFNGLSTRKASNAYIEETHIFNSHLVNVARIGYNRSNIFQTISGAGRENYAQEFGLNALSPAPRQWVPPSVSMTSYSSIGNSTTPDGAIQNLFQYADEVNWVLGRHAIVMGVELDRIQFNANWTVYNGGTFAFNGQYTNNHQASASGGSSIADLVLGYPYNAKGAVGTTVGAFRQYNITPYIQDEWRATEKLSLNLGLRYDYYQSPDDLHHHANTYDVATNTTRNGSFDQNYLNFAPRVGFAYSLTPQTVVHGGYGIYYALPLYNNYQFLLSNPPNYILQNNTYKNTELVPTGSTFVTDPSASSQAPFTVARKTPTPYVQQYNVSIQRSIGPRIVATAAYVGSKSTHLQLRHNPNQASVPTDPSDPGTLQSRRPFSWIGDVYEAANLGFGNYNGLEISLQGTFRSGASFSANYVYSKALDVLTSEERNPESGTDLARDYGLADFNQTHVVKLSGIYPLPFGAGRRFLNSNWVETEILGGWNISGSLLMNGGFPFHVAATDTSNTGAYHTQRANQVCSGKLSHPTAQEWFDTSCFVQPRTYQLGNERRNNLIGPHDTDTNFSASKNFAMPRESYLQFRADFFHALNHPLLELPNASTSAKNNGIITGFGGSRAIQGSLKLVF